MNLIDALNISATGLYAQRIRMNIISANLANVNTTRTPQGGPYRKKEVIFKAIEKEDFSSELERYLQGVKVLKIVESKKPFRIVYDPTHPDADKNGYVKYPNVNIIEEMVDLISAEKSYEANIAAINAIKNMINKSLEIGR